MTSRTIGKLIYSLRKGDLLLPNFQRPFVWDPERWQSLMASILLEYPVGQALIGTEAHSHLMSVRKPLSIPEQDLRKIFMEKADLSVQDIKHLEVTQYLQKGERYFCDYLLDGQQRLTALDLMLGSAYHFSGNELSRKYRLRWFLNLTKLGLQELQWINIRETQHEEACEIICFVKYKKTDNKSPYFLKNKDSVLADFCMVKKLQEEAGLEEGIYLPLDKLYSDEDPNFNSLQYDPNFLIDFFEERQKIIILNHTNEGKILKENQSLLNEEEYEQRYKKLKIKFLVWQTSLQTMLENIIKFEFPVLEVTSKEFNRLAGIFSVINMGGIELSTFDLLVAKTTTSESSLRDIMKSLCLETFQEFNNSAALIPEPAKSNDENNFWSLGTFLGEKNAEDVDAGIEFPESIARPFAQTIVLHAKLAKVLGPDWSCRDNLLAQCKTSNDSEWLVNPTFQEIARSILRLDDWGYSDKLILGLSRQEVQSVQEQAAKQILRAYFLMKSRLGFVRLSHFPYRQMDLVLATILTDSVWTQLNIDPTGTLMQKIQWWYWGSIFGGAYQKAYSSIDKRVLADIPRLLAYLYKPTIKWEQVSNLYDGTSQCSWNGSELEEPHFKESLILGADGKSGNRFEMICNASGYSTKEVLTKSPNRSIGFAILAFMIRKGLSDFKFSSKKNTDFKRGKKLHTGRKDLQADHIFAINSWKKFTGEKVDRNDDHPINSPLNYSWSSADANRHWSDHPSFMKLELKFALNGDRESIDFLNEHLLDLEAVKNEYTNIVLKSEEDQKENAKEVFQFLIENRFNNLRQRIFAENPEV
ncbi:MULTISPECIES: DUF262 domain-containing protein [Spirulina sp. CCY15215]|uniref:DUF262 domain-containing protein n=1 Tax=Spirulina sp. CCY15215 TaxID=2767591 RepID=UPI00194E54D4|nr:DUF262 domain-containing protein [Spirulina major]